MNKLKIKIERNKRSYQFRADPSKPDSFDNNWKNNSLDFLILSDGDKEAIRVQCQTVANYCFGGQRPGDTRPDGDTVAPGEFQVKCFVPPRAFHGEIHAVTSTRDLDGQWIDRNAMQTTAGGFQNGRWLIHDRWSEKTRCDTNFAWSAGCIILASDDLELLNSYFKFYDIKSGDVIPGELVEV
jgi:hypothetical protein